MLRVLLIGVVPVVAALVAAELWLESTRYVTTENAYVKAHHLAVSADIDGRAVRVFVRENDRVKRGDPLFELDPERHRIELARAEADLGMIRNTLAALRAEYRGARAELAEAEEEIRYFGTVFDRQKQLSTRGVASRATYDEAERNLTQARQAARTLNQRIQQVLARLGGTYEGPDEHHPMYVGALARRDQAELDLLRTRVAAPADGVVGRIILQPGEYVEEGRAVIPLIASAETWIEANLKETQLNHVAPGQTATIRVDAYPDHVWKAKVASISPSTGAELSVLPPQNASGNWVKVVQRVPVRLNLEPDHEGLLLRAGMTVSVSIDTERERSLFRTVGSAVARIHSTE
ncbi:MAG: HlyD family secretion protein [Rhodospirillaceae bacterium]